MQDALPAYDQVQQSQPNLLLRHDTILGVCEGIGEEFGFHPNFLRVPFAAGILWNPMAIAGIYLGLGAALVLARWLYPKPRAAGASQLVADQRPVHVADAHAADNADGELSVAA